jgi:hypothetical protein
MSHYSRSLVAAAFASALAVSFAQADPAAPPAHEQVLRNLIDKAARGQVDEAIFTPELAAAIRPQAANTRADLTALGRLTSVALESTSPSGTDYYLTTFEHGSLEWAFSMTPDGRISNARYRTPKP